MRERLNSTSRFAQAVDFNINILNDTNFSTDFFKRTACFKFSLTYYMLPTRVTNNTATLIDNFMCDFSLLPVRTCVVKIVISDHYL